MSVGTIWSVDGWTGYEGMNPVADDLGCLHFVTATDGWQGAPPPRVESEDRPAADGTNDGDPTQPGRTVTIEGTTRAPDVVTLLQVMDRMSGVLVGSTRWDFLQSAEAHMTRRLWVRRGADTLIAPLRNVQKEASFSFVLYGPDPRRVADDLIASTGLPSTSGGITVPLVVPVVLAETVVSGVCSLFNPGTAVGAVKLRIDGPCVGPVVTHVGTGTALVFSSDLSLGAGEWLEVDMEKHEALANGQADASRNNTITGRGWSGFDKGLNAWSFTALSGGPAARLTVTATPSW